MLLGVEPIATYFYSLAWWSYIILLSGLNHLRGNNSLLLDRPREFLWVFLYSTPVWLFFELYNFRLENWHYVGIPAENYLRWPGYFIAFGTVLPGILETRTLLGNWGVFSQVRSRPLRVHSGLLLRLNLLGATMLILPLLRPQYFFPLIWVGCTLLLDPILYRSDESRNTFLGKAKQGDYALPVQLLAAGMVCGLLWEFWNYWASAKWVYTVPYVGFLKVFEMPLLGFFGFPPFALECYLFYRALCLLRRRFLSGHRLRTVAVCLVVALYSSLILAGIDRWTIRLYKEMGG